MDEKQIRDEFKLRLSGVEDGTRCFSIHCEKAFFELAEISEVRDGELDLRIEMTKTEKLVNVLCQFNGYVVAPCDRCLLPVRLPMDFEQRLIVKLVPNIGEEPESEDEVVRTKSVYLEPMSLEEAITRMEALGHNFFVYLDNEDDQISVVYKRVEGGYGILQAENKLA